MRHTTRSCPKRQPIKKPIPSIELTPGLLYAYTDGSTFRANPGPISWGVVFVKNHAVVRVNGRERTLTGAALSGTNGRAELMAVICALEDEQYEDLGIVTDSLATLHYIVGNWARKRDRDLWQRFDHAALVRTKHGCQTLFYHVKGHHVDPFNRQADRLAATFARANWALLSSSSDEAENPSGSSPRSASQED